ncbi:uncharacterized protein Tco025E_08284 [Trypanosoma conorhini]|uniref:Mucin-associated surface protein (MASP) n=1 Tax=Trypanosoma conorhini TaxID=83891 RepID=A0A3R7NM72_9TRYP|nr:uncharacterized protein Tco025E_08284 [Trypanosoma conorhini]RNF04734.1 hypothetical protein Tco025E_08284 [Trypanosoma conorhini]
MAGRALLLVCALCALCCAAGGGWAWHMDYCNETQWTYLKAVNSSKTYTELLDEFCGTKKEFVEKVRAEAEKEDGVVRSGHGGAGATGSAPVSAPGAAVGAVTPDQKVSENGEKLKQAPPPAESSRGSAEHSESQLPDGREGREEVSPQGGSTEASGKGTVDAAAGSAKQSSARSTPTAGGEGVVSGLTEGRPAGKAGETAPPESTVQRNPVQHDNTPAAEGTAKTSRDTAGGEGSNNPGSDSGSGPAVQPQPQPGSSVAANEAGDAEQKEQSAVPTSKQEAETRGGGERQATQQAAGAAVQAVSTTNSTSATKAVTGDSDGSSAAASHSTSPLALLLLLACAAAATMVAA